MPTGYTSGVNEGKVTNVNEYIMGCARAFGALIEMRDSSMDAVIPDQFEPSDHHKKQIERSKQALADFNELTTEEIMTQINKEYENRIADQKKSLAKNNELRSRYLHMIADVHAWQPPTSDHIKLKEFCLSQLNDSLKWDCNDEYYLKPIEKENFSEWVSATLNRYLKDVAYHEKEWEAEVLRVAERNKWVNDLRNSLFQNTSK